jgi:BirA family transcriptional regulator, biotin operon repressor / biotin---[acetyl-CoA-carboxylase] ligase
LTGSTNADLIQRVPSGVPEGLWLRADAQNEGRGRMGRVWESPPANLFASTIVRLRPLDPPAPSLAFIIALAVLDTITQIAPQVTVMIKWPNDILSTEGAKICGMLLERSGDAVIIGVGLNLVHHPKDLDRPVNDLLALGANCPHPQAVVEILADAFDIWLTRWRDMGLPAVFKAWQAGAHPVGTALSVNLPSGEIYEGLYAGLSDDGALQLRLADGSIRAIHAADVFLI